MWDAWLAAVITAGEILWYGGGFGWSCHSIGGGSNIEECGIHLR